MENIINAVVSEMTDSTGIDELKKALNIAIKATGYEFNGRTWNDMFTEILYKLHVEEA